MLTLVTNFSKVLLFLAYDSWSHDFLWVFPLFYNTSNASCNISNLLRWFPDFVGEKVDSYNKCIIYGDINIHCDMDDNYEKQWLDNILDSFDLKQMVDVPTHESGHTLDILITPTLDNLIISSLISDHWFVEFKIKFEKAIRQKKEIAFRLLCRIDDDVLVERLSNMLHKSNVVDDWNLVSYFNNSMTEIIDQLAPKKEKRLNSQHTNEWYTEESLHLRQEVRKYERKYRKSNLASDKIIFKTIFNSYRIHLWHARKSYINNVFKDCGNNQRKLFHTLNRLVSKKQENTLPEGDNQELSENFCRFFFDKIDKIQKDLEGYDNFTPNSSNAHLLSNFMSVDYIDAVEIVRNTKSTCFTDPCPARMI